MFILVYYALAVNWQDIIPTKWLLSSISNVVGPLISRTNGVTEKGSA